MIEVCPVCDPFPRGDMPVRWKVCNRHPHLEDRSANFAREIWRNYPGVLADWETPPAHPGTVPQPVESSPEYSLTVTFTKDSDIEDLAYYSLQIARLFGKATR